MRPHPAPDGPQAGEDSSGASDLVPPTRSAPPPAAAAAAAAKADAGLAERDEASALTVAGTGPAAGGSSHGSDGEPAARGPLPALDPGALVDHRYRVLRELGAGGFAAVYLVEDLFDEGRVRALKLLRPRSRFAQRAFRAEFRVLAGLDHPGLARVHEFGQLPGAALYFTQEFVPGLPMHRARLQGGADADLPDLVLQVCAALGYIHENGVLHRDVKPSNLIVTPPDEPSGRRAKLLDFGLAGVISPGRVAPVAGTLRYLAPEILREEHADQRADLYSLGATLYTVVAGRPPFLGSEDELVRAVCTTEAPPLPITVPRWLVRLCLALLAKDPAERPASAAEVAGLVARWTGRAPGGSAEALQGPSVREAPVAGREEERRALLAVYAVAAHGWADHENEPRVVVLRGETGSGKGRILRTLRHEVQLHGGTFYEAAFRDRAAGPLEPIADVLGRALAQAGWEEKVLPDDREALGRLLPELAQHARVRRRTFAVEAADERRRMAAAVYETLCRLFARRPGVLAFEEARWAGRDAVDVLLDVATLMQRDAHPPRLLVVLATRPGTIVEEALAKAGLCRTLALGPLGDEEVRGIVRGALGAAAAADEGLVRDVVALSGGNPLHALEALRLRAEGGRLPDGGAPALDEVVRARLMLRPPPAQEILATLAVLGKPVPLELLLQASPTPPAEPLRALRPLLDGGLLRVTRGDAGPLYGFAREIYRRVAEELVGTDAARARIRHRRAAAALARSKPDERSVDAAGHHSAVAYHWEQAGMADRALQQHRRAAAAATEQLANGVAIVHVEAAVRLGRRLGGAARLAELLAELDDLCELLGDRPRQAAAVRELQELAARPNAPATVRALAAYRRARLAEETADHATLRAAAAEAIGAAAAAGDRLHLARTQLLVGRDALGAGENERARAPLEEAERLFRELGDYRGQCEALTALSRAAFYEARLDDAMAPLREALRIAGAHRDRALFGRTLVQVGVVYKAHGQLREAARLLRRAALLFRRIGARRLESTALANLGATLADAGLFLEAREALEAAVALKTEIGDAPGALIATGNLALVQMYVGEVARAEEGLRRAARDAAEMDLGRTHAHMLYLLADARAAQDALEEAIGRYQEAMSHAERHGEELLQLYIAPSFARALLRRNAGAGADRARALGLIGRVLDTPRTEAMLAARAKALLALALCLDEQGAAVGALAAAAEATAIVEGGVALPGVIGTEEEVRWHLARLLRAAGRQEEADAVLARARARLREKAAALGEGPAREGLLRTFSMGGALTD